MSAEVIKSVLSRQIDDMEPALDAKPVAADPGAVRRHVRRGIEPVES